MRKRLSSHCHGMIRKIIIRLPLLLIKSLQKIRIFFYFLASTNRLQAGKVVRIQPVHLLGRGKISVEGTVNIGYFPSPMFMNTYAHVEARGVNSSIFIGDGTYVNNNFVTIAEHTSISIGKRCMIGTGVEILDSDFHGIRLVDRSRSQPEWAKPVVIGDDVFIGSNVRILKGVTIGDGSVVANASVVTKDIPPNVIAAGSPAKVLKEIE